MRIAVLRLRALRMIACAVLLSSLGGCAAIITRGPPSNHAQRESFTCGTSKTPARIDVGMAGVYFFGAFFQMDGGHGLEPAWVAANLTLSAAHAYSAVRGYRKVRKCRAALEQLAARRALAPSPR